MSRVGQTRLAGHSLVDEGRVWTHFWRAQVGTAHCSCGARSPELPSDSARKAWHRDHKEQIRAALGQQP